MNWIHYTYFYTRVTKSPISYGIPERAVVADPTLNRYLHDLLDGMLVRLAEGGLCVYDRETGQIAKMELGRIASYYYVQTEALGEMASELARESDYEDILDLLCGYIGMHSFS